MPGSSECCGSPTAVRAPTPPFSVPLGPMPRATAGNTGGQDHSTDPGSADALAACRGCRRLFKVGDSYGRNVMPGADWRTKRPRRPGGPTRALALTAVAQPRELAGREQPATRRTTAATRLVGRPHAQGRHQAPMAVARRGFGRKARISGNKSHSRAAWNPTCRKPGALPLLSRYQTGRGYQCRRHQHTRCLAGLRVKNSLSPRQA